jgi:hypothetical protein
MSSRACVAGRFAIPAILSSTLAVAAIVGLAMPTSAGVPSVGSWTKLPPPSVRDAATALDRARNRLLIFGGNQGEVANNELWALSLGGSPAWTRVVTSGTPPPARHNHNMLYSLAHDELWVFGGVGASETTLNDVWILSLGGTPTWSHLSPSGTPPVARAYASAVLDSVNDRVVLFGGAQAQPNEGPPSGFLNDVWSMSLSGPPAWTSLSPSGSAPSARAGVQAIWDGANHRVVLYGGFDGNFLGDAYALGLSGSPAWSTLTPSGTPPTNRAVGSAVWDPTGNRMVIYGGYGGTSNNMLSDAWSLSLGGSPAWTALSPSGGPPYARQSPTSVYNPMTHSMVMYGGGGDGNGGDVTDLAWSLSLSGSPAWNEIGGRSMPRTDGATAIFDPIRGRLVTFGGRPSQTYTNEVWMYDLVGNWTQLTPTGTPPAPRTGHTTIYDPVRDRMLVYGGTDSVNTYGDVWALSLSGSPAWTHVVTNGGPPVARFQHVAVYDSQRDRMVVHGGGGPGDTGEMWALNLSTNTWTSVIGSPSGPGFRQDHAAVYDPINDRIVMFGGTSDDALWSVNFSGTPTWSQLAHNGTPPLARSGMAAVYDAPAHSMLIFGGSEAASYDSVENETSLLHLIDTPEWTQLDLGADKPAPRRASFAAIDPSTETFYIGGGCCNNVSDLWMTTIDHATPVQASMVSTSATPEGVELTWWVSDAEGEVTIERNDRSGWKPVGTGWPAGNRLLEFHDANVVAGRSYGYRLIVTSDGGKVAMAEVWVDVPEAAQGLAVIGFRPNPAPTGASVYFTLPNSAPARLEVLDVAGRRVFSREVGGLGAGQHLVRVDRATPPGVYVLRLTQSGRAVTAKATLTH